MFGKLLKYEFKSTAKWYLLMTLIVLGLSVLVGVIGGSNASNANFLENQMLETIIGILFILIFGILIVLFLSNYYIIIRRFYTNLYGREGYLTWTLPASPHAILLSKFLGAWIASIYCFVLLYICGIVTLLVMGSVTGEDLSLIWDNYLSILSHSFTLWQIVWIMVTTASGILMFYVSIALGQLFQNRRGLKAILFGLLWWVVLSIIGTIVNPFRDLENIFNLIGTMSSTTTDDFGIDFIPGLIYEAIKIVSMYFTIHYISKYKLNLQ